MVNFDALDCDDTFFGGEEPCGRGGVGEHEEETGRGDEREDARDDDEPLPGLEVARVRVEGPERDEPYDDLCCRAVRIAVFINLPAVTTWILTGVSCQQMSHIRDKYQLGTVKMDTTDEAS